MKTVTIVFRGLMVFNKQPNPSTQEPLKTMEIGFVDALFQGGGGHAGTGPPVHDAHIPRILTMKNGVVAEVQDLRLRPELGTVRNWELVVTDSTQPVSTDEQGAAPFDRRTHNVARDFRFITDLEANDLHNRSLSAELNTRQLLLVLYVRHGLFFTQLQSPALRRIRINPPPAPVTYGPSAAVVGCEITFADTGKLQLMAGGSTGAMVKEFVAEQGTIYEISNAPPDVPVDAPVPPTAPGHFHMYYDKLFNMPPSDQFDLIRDDGAPAPDPALCGVTFLGLRKDPL